MNVRQELQRRDFWLHLEVNVAIVVAAAAMLATFVLSQFVG
jgi:hypothetical protein